MCSGKCQGAAAREWLAEREASAAHSIAGIIGRRGHSHFGRVEDGRGENTFPMAAHGRAPRRGRPGNGRSNLSAKCPISSASIKASVDCGVEEIDLSAGAPMPYEPLAS
jgi:hypothetical protein